MKILLAVDGSDFTKRMLAYLAAHDELLGARNEFTALTVVPPVPPQVTQFINRGSLDSYYADQAAAVLDPIKKFAAQQGWEVFTRHEVGHATDVVAKAATAGEFDMLVLGSHGHTSLGSLVMGSVPSGVLARCKVPTLIIR
jgi:nucleotide-binding universal stress UspA family protein